MKNTLTCYFRQASTIAVLLLAWLICQLQVQANPTGGTVAQGAASFNTSGSQLTINQTSGSAFINWQSFNIGVGETTTFIQPSASSVAWNLINDVNPSQILGNLNANGYVVLQNPNGFSVGGQAAITAHGLVMTTASTPAINLSGGGAWAFNAPPPTAKIINYGRVNITGGGPAFLIASDIENHGTISAPKGNIGLYAGEHVLVSMSPDGRGLSAAVTLPVGSVDNQGNLIADAGSIAAQARFVNQNGLIQANSVRNNNGVIELIASDQLSLGANSQISANGDNASSGSSGGDVTLKSGNTFSDEAGSQISVTGGARGGNGGNVEISAVNVQSLNSGINARAQAGWTAGKLLLDPDYIILDTSGSGSAGTGTVLAGDNPGGTLDLNVNSAFANLAVSQIILQALYDITLAGGTTWNLSGTIGANYGGVTGGQLTLEAGRNIIFGTGAQITDANNWSVTLQAGYDFVNHVLQSGVGTIYLNGGSSIQTRNGNITLQAGAIQTQPGGNIAVTATDGNIELNSVWSLADANTPASLNLIAGNNIIFDNNNSGIDNGIIAGNNWSVNLVAGTALAPGSLPASGNDGIYLSGSSYIQSQNGNINLWAANEVEVGWSGAANSRGRVNSGSGSITTVNGGSINVTTLYGDVNTGSNPSGFDYHNTQPFYTVDYSLGGISTAAGGNVMIAAGGDVISYLPSGSTSVAAADGGSGAFGPEPGNVTIIAGGSVYGHYVVADGVGTIAAGQNVGSAAGNPFALSLMDGSWSVNAPNGNIYLQEVRNPNGVFNHLTGNGSRGKFLFDYDPQASVNLTAGNGVYLTSLNVPRPYGNVPVLYPPILDITAGSGGVTLEGNVTLFPSPDQNLTITTTGGGNLTATPGLVIPFELLMSDSAQTQWRSATTFSDSDHGSLQNEPDNPNPVLINVSGSMENLTLITTKATEITVGGDMINCGFSGQNLQASDVTSITVAGQIYNRSAYSFVYLDQAIPSVPVGDLPPGMANSWVDIFTLAVDPTTIANLMAPASYTQSQLLPYALETAGLFSVTAQPSGLRGVNPGFVYNPATGRLGFAGSMSQSVLSDLTPPITVLRIVNGLPVVDSTGHFVTDTITWVASSEIAALYQASQGAPANPQLGYRIGGPGQFNIAANSISLGNSYGILSCGVGDRYANLASITPSGATVNVTVAGNLDMLTSTIAALGGGDVNVTSTGGSMDLGSQDLFSSSDRVPGFGIFTTGHGNVNVTALGDIDINGSRIATFNGGDIFVESLQGTVNVGSGSSDLNTAYVSYVDPATGKAALYQEYFFGSGIEAMTLVPPRQGQTWPPNPASVPGNITVLTPRGDIIASLGGILQEALDGSITAGPTINLIAGTFASGTPSQPDYFPGYAGNIDLGNSGVIGGTVNLSANGNITGLVISRQNSTVNAAQSFSGSLLSGGSANLSAGGTVTGTIIGVGGASVSGGSVSAEVLGQNVSVNGGASQSTLGSSANATSSSQSAAQQANSQAQQQVASSETEDDDQKKKKKKPIIKHIGRVTVILSALVPAR